MKELPLCSQRAVALSDPRLVLDRRRCTKCEAILRREHGAAFPDGLEVPVSALWAAVRTSMIQERARTTTYYTIPGTDETISVAREFAAQLRDCGLQLEWLQPTAIPPWAVDDPKERERLVYAAELRRHEVILAAAQRLLEYRRQVEYDALMMRWHSLSEADRDRLIAKQRRDNPEVEKAAEGLLETLLSPYQRRRWRERAEVLVPSTYWPDGTFSIPGERRGRLVFTRAIYRIRPRRRVAILQRVVGGAPGGALLEDPRLSLCLQTTEVMPVADEVASLVLLARHDEKRMWRLAATHWEPA